MPRRRCNSTFEIQVMEPRLLLSAGGGFVGGGISGDYFANQNLTGSPSFTRVDDRVDFTFNANTAPGGSSSPGFNAVAATNWSARWTGQVIPAYSETYTFTTTSSAGVRLYIQLPGSTSWTLLINNWTSHTPAVDTATYALQQGQVYGIKLEYYQLTGPAEIKLHWSSPSTPDTAIEPATPVGINFDSGYGGDAAFANLVNGGSRNVWYTAGSFSSTVATDSNFWPKSDSEIFLDEGDSALNSGGTYLIQFQGTAQINQSGVSGSFYVGNQNYFGSIPAGVGYNSSSGLTTATLVVNPGNYNGFTLEFTNTSRENNVTTPQHDGFTNLFVMQPTTPAGNTTYSPGTLFTNAALNMLSQYDTLRLMGFTDTNDSLVSNWSDRTVPSDQIWNGWSITPDSGVTANVTTTAGTGIPWEICVALANQTGKDVYINIPSNASLDYITKLADLFAFGSDGINPYTTPQSNPLWAPLNPNLKVYIEFSNEIWNYAFTQSGTGGNGWIDQISQRAVYDYLTGNHNDSLYPGGGANGYNDGAYIAPQFINSGNQSAFLATYNGPNASWPGYGSPQYFSNSATVTGQSIYQGWVALRLEQISSAFKTAFNETAINGDSISARVRPVLEWQYGGSWSGELGEMQAIFSAQHPVGYYLYGGGGGWYSDNTTGGFSDSTFANDVFSSPTVVGSQQNPTDSGWTFTGAAGIAANGSSLGNPTASTVGPPNNTGGSLQTAYLLPGASISQSVNFSGGWADITLLAAQTQASNYYPSYYGTTISIDGSPINQEEGPILYSGSSTAGTWAWSRTTAFNVSAGVHTVTFTNNWPSGGATVFMDDLAIQTVNGLFNETDANGIPSITSNIKSDVALCLQYGLNDVGYEGGYDFNQNLDGGGINGYSELGSAGYSSATPNVGLEANLDPRTQALTQTTLNQFYSAGGTLPVVFESSSNINSWAVAAPTYFNYTTPKQLGVMAIEQMLPPAASYGITVPNTLVQLNSSQSQNDTNGTLQAGGFLAWEIEVPITGTYQFAATTTSGGNYSFSINGINIFASGTSGGTINPTFTLTPGLYSFSVTDTSGSFTLSQVVVSLPGAPGAPTITSSSLTGGTANLSWSAVTGAAGYIIAYGNSAGQYTQFPDVGNVTSGTLTGLSSTAVYHVAIYAYDSAQRRSLPSADVRLAQASADPSMLVDFENQAAGDNVTKPVAEPLTFGQFQFSSLGNSAGSGLVIHDSADTYYGFPTKVLFANYWGTDQLINRADSHAFDLFSLDLETTQAASAVITGYDPSGGTVTQAVNFIYPATYDTAHVTLAWTDLSKVVITWWDNLNGVSNARDGAIDNVVFNDTPPVIAAAVAAPATVMGTSTVLSVMATDNNGESNLLYTWIATTLPSGAAAPIVTDNNSNTAKNTTAYFSSAGTYVFTVTVTDGSNLVATQTVPVTVLQSASVITVTPASPTVTDGTTRQLAAVTGDQFGAAVGTQPAFTWSLIGGAGSVNSNGQFTPPSTGSGWSYVTAAAGSQSGATAIYYTQSASPNFYNGFSSGALTLAGNAVLSGSHVRLTSGRYEAGAAWYPTKLSTSSFVTDFEFQNSNIAGTNIGGNGLTFTIQNQSVTAVGSNQTGLGYQGITSSAALKFDLIPWDSNWTSSTGAGNLETDSIGVYTGGSAPTVPATDLSSTRLQLRNGDLFQAHVVYNGTNLTLTLTDMTDVHHWSNTTSYAINIPSAVGASTAWFGFTAGSTQPVTGSYQDVLWWTYGQPQASISPFASSLASGPTGLTVNFNRPVYGLNSTNVTLTRDGQAISLGSNLLVSTGNLGLSYQLAGFSGLSANLGQYTLGTISSGITDAGGNSPANTLSAVWTIDTLNYTNAGNFITIAGLGGSAASVTINNASAYTINLNTLPAIIVDTAGGGNSLTLDFTNGSPLPLGGLTFSAGGGVGNALTVIGTAAADSATLGGSQLLFDGSVITLSQVQSVTLNTGGGNDSLTQTSQPTAAAVTFNGGAGSDQLTVQAGSYTFTTDPQPLTSSLTVIAAGAAAQILFNPTNGNQLHIAGLSLTGGAVAIVESLGPQRTAANHLALILGNAGTTTAPLFTIDSSSDLNLQDNDLILHDGNLPAVNALLTSGFNSGAVPWAGSGISSGVAAANPLTALAISQAAASGTFDGESIAPSDILVKYSYYGDATLDGKVDGSDYSRIDFGYINQLTGWFNGDLNYDGVINGSDYTLIDNAYNQQATPLSQIANSVVADARARPVSKAFSTQLIETASIIAAPVTRNEIGIWVTTKALASKRSVQLTARVQVSERRRHDRHPGRVVKSDWDSIASF